MDGEWMVMSFYDYELHELAHLLFIRLGHEREVGERNNALEEGYSCRYMKNAFLACPNDFEDFVSPGNSTPEHAKEIFQIVRFFRSLAKVVSLFE